MLLTRRQAARIRLVKFRLCRWLCHGRDLIRHWLGSLAKRYADRRLALVHTFVWIVATLWLLFQAVVLLHANFPLTAAERFIAGLRQQYPVLDWFLTHARPLGSAMIIAWLRDMTNDWYKLRQDAIRATTLIKGWLSYLVLIAATSTIIHHRFVYPDEVVDTNLFILTLLVMKWLSRQVTHAGKDGEISPKAKKNLSWVNMILRHLIKQVAK